MSVVEVDRMNYYATGLLIIAFVLLAFFGGPVR